MNTKVVIQRILLWGLPIVATVLIILSVYFGLLANKGWKTYPEIYDNGYLIIDKQGRIWSIPSGCLVRGGLSIFDSGIWTTYEQANSGLPAQCIRAIAFDDREQVWIGTDDSIRVFDGRDTNLLATGTQLPENSFINSLNEMTDIAIDQEGRVWVGSSDGLSIFDGKKWGNFNQEEYEALGPDLNSVLNIDFDKQGRAWIQTYRGITAIDNEKWVTYLESDSSGNQGMFFDHQGRVWIPSCGTATDDSYLSVIDGEIETKYSNMPDGCISSIDFDLNGNAWVLFQKPNFQFDLFIFDGKIWTSLLNIISDSYSYPIITFDQQGQAWVGTGDGISIYSGKTWTQYTKFNSGLGDNHINNIVFDKQGEAWITTGNEINVATPSEFVKVISFFVSPLGKLYIPGLLVILWIAINPVINPIKQKIISKLKESTISKSERYRLGFLSGGILSFLSLALIPSIAYGTFIISPFILIQALILGVLSGFGGLIIGTIWQKKIGAVVGGLIALIVSSPLLLWFSSCVFLGGC